MAVNPFSVVSPSVMTPEVTVLYQLQWSFTYAYTMRRQNCSPVRGPVFYIIADDIGAN
jgi:hypothetical protein